MDWTTGLTFIHSRACAVYNYCMLSVDVQLFPRSVVPVEVQLFPRSVVPVDIQLFPRLVVLGHSHGGSCGGYQGLPNCC